MVSFIILKNQPVTTAEDDSFGDIFKIFSETPRMISNDTVRRRIFTLFDEEKAALKSTLEVRIIS